MRPVRIGLFGAAINNDNLGCVALTYSLLKLLEDASEKLDLSFEYCVFEAKPNRSRTEMLSRELEIGLERLHAYRISSLYSVASLVKHPFNGILAYSALCRCDLCIDITEGDSFTDIYGQRRFDRTARIKELVQKKRIPLILGPQTYGPFNNEENALRAKRIIEKSFVVMARDKLSAEFIKSISDKEVFVCTDLAFSLPYSKKKPQKNGKFNIGVNISSLLIKNKAEVTQRHFSIKADYDQYIERLLTALRDNTKFNVVIIPHVGEDGGFQFTDAFPEFEYLPPFPSPIKAKEFISGLDIFVGSRMHATIAAFSSGVVTIPVGYSRKFIGLYENLGYKYTVDLQSLDEREAFDLTMQYIEKHASIRDDLAMCLEKAEKEKDRMKCILTESIQKACPLLHE
ncbi:MAG: polysaccharide pyruvyl transferase family protein [Solobacterium sp.]|nr:polysaccharide pyruvyl transferase family protein [Solobacterium sp.]